MISAFIYCFVWYIGVISLPVPLPYSHQQFLSTCELRGHFLLFAKSYYLSMSLFLSAPSSSLEWLKSLNLRLTPSLPAPPPPPAAPVVLHGEKEKETKQKRKEEEIWDHTPFAIAPFLTHTNAEVRAEAAHAYAVLASHAPLRALPASVALAFRLARETDADALHAVVYSLAGMATRKACVGPVMRTLTPLLQTPELSAAAVRY